MQARRCINTVARNFLRDAFRERCVDAAAWNPAHESKRGSEFHAAKKTKEFPAHAAG
jgi:hypothetical protein